MARRIELVRGPIVVESLTETEYQKPGTITAQLRQEIETKSFYPSRTTSNELNDNVFDNDEFGFEEQEFTSKETRVAWILVPTGTPIADVRKRITDLAEPRLYKQLSNRPILTSDQRSAIARGLRTLDDYANSQVVRYPDGHDQEDQPILDNNNFVQYRKVFFSREPKEDVDLRQSDPAKVYLSADLKEEVEDGVITDAHVITDQTV